MKKLCVFLVHGTWAGSGEWTHYNSLFRKVLREEFGYRQYAVRYAPSFRSFHWNGANRWRARDDAIYGLKKFIKEVVNDQRPDFEYVVVAHSHGGNIATDAVRELLRDDAGFAVRRVVCLNTPFLKREVRGSSDYLKYWCFLGGALSVALAAAELWRPTPAKVAGFSGLSPLLLLIVLLFVTALLALCVKLSQREIKKRRGRLEPWGPRPEVLCLSCPDDEAITSLGLGEGLSNLPQLLLHPFALVAAIVVGVTVCLTNLPLPPSRADRIWQLDFAAELFTAWAGFALLMGLMGAFVLTLLFGLHISDLFRTLVSRTLVSYTPLRPAETYFRCIYSVPFPRHPIHLFHSAIYRSQDTVRFICSWLNATENSAKRSDTVS